MKLCLDMIETRLVKFRDRTFSLGFFIIFDVFSAALFSRLLLLALLLYFYLLKQPELCLC